MLLSQKFLIKAKEAHIHTSAINATISKVEPLMKISTGWRDRVSKLPPTLGPPL